MTHPFLAVGCESTVPCLFRSVYQMDKAELSLRFNPQQRQPAEWTRRVLCWATSLDGNQAAFLMAG